MLAGMQTRVGSGAKGVMMLLVSGLPDGKATTMLEWSGVQAFDARTGGKPGAQQGRNADVWTVTQQPEEKAGSATSWGDAWREWTSLKDQQAGSFAESSPTTWFHGQGEEDSIEISPHRRLLFSPLPSTVQVEIALGPNFFHLKAHRAFRASSDLSEIILGLDAVQRLQERKGAGRPKAPTETG
jgi:hypothetical protein